MPDGPGPIRHVVTDTLPGQDTLATTVPYDGEGFDAPIIDTVFLPAHHWRAEPTNHAQREGSVSEGWNPS